MSVGIMAASFAWIFLLINLFKDYFNYKIPVVTMIGQNTFPVFLLHGFVMRAIPVKFVGIWNIPAAIIWITCAVVLVFGNSVMGKIFKWLFSEHWGKMGEYFAQ